MIYFSNCTSRQQRLYENSKNQTGVMYRLPRFQISDDLHISIGGSVVQITPARGLQIAETLARKSFRRALSEEAETAAPKPATKRRES